MRVLLDTDVVLDVLLARPAFVAPAAAIWLAHEQGRITAHVAAITPMNVAYIVRRARDLTVARIAVDEILRNLRLCPVDAATLQRAFALPMADYEDAVQVASALALGLDAIITRNVNDFANTPLPVLTPEELLRRLTGNTRRGSHGALAPVEEAPPLSLAHPFFLWYVSIYEAYGPTQTATDARTS